MQWAGVPAGTSVRPPGLYEMGGLRGVSVSVCVGGGESELCIGMWEGELGGRVWL